MSLLTTNPLFNSLITFSKNGIRVATYAEIRTAITSRYQEIYGEDIDVSSSTADGQYIEMMCLIISNMFMSFKTLYGNLDVKTAQGKFLDMLAALTNVTREPGRHSTASLNITLTSQASLTVGPSYTQSDVTELQFIDKAGLTWTFKPNTQQTFTQYQAQTIVVTCDEGGPVRADAHWIETTVDGSILMTVIQNEPAEIGTYDETDSQLRARRLQSLGSSGITVLQSLVGAARSIEGVDDIKIYNNDTVLGAMTAKDGTSVPIHSVYVIIRKLANANISDSLLGSTLYEKMTPGIHFTATTDTTHGVDKSYRYVQTYQGQTIPTIAAQYARWKEATPVHPTITITLKKQVVNPDVYSQTFSSAYSSATSNAIIRTIVDYMNALPLSEDANLALIRMQAQLADPMFKGLPTYFVESVEIDDEYEVEDVPQGYYKNPDTFYDYKIEESEETSDVDDVVTITIGG